MTNAHIRSRYLMTGGARTHYVEAGEEGPAIVMCHGGAPGGSAESGFGRLMPLLADRFRLYALDSVGGFGLTDTSYRAVEGSQSRVVQLEHFVDTLCLDEFGLIGNSQGAWVVAKYALDHPERVRALCMTGSNTIPSAMGLKVPVTDAVRAVLAYDGSRDAMRRILELSTNDKGPLDEEDFERRYAVSTRPGALEAQAIYRAGQDRLSKDPNHRIKFDMRHTLPQLQLPGMFLWGEEDGFVPVSMARELEALLPNFEFRFVPGAGHAVHHDQPEVAAGILREFFGEHLG